MAASTDIGGSAYREILNVARRFVRSDDEARDLAQDALMIALAQGFHDWSSGTLRPWLVGVLRKRAAFVVRSNKRRGERERDAVAVDDPRPASWVWRSGFLASLPPSLRAVAVLASADLCAAEIRWLLVLNDAALRSRLSALRCAVRAESEPPTHPAPEPELGLGMRRRQLLASLRKLPGSAVATHDPDGHTLLFRVVPHKNEVVGNT